MRRYRRSVLRWIPADVLNVIANQTIRPGVKVPLDNVSRNLDLTASAKHLVLQTGQDGSAHPREYGTLT